MSLPLHGEWRCFGVCRLQSGPAICEKRGHMLDSITDTVFPRSVENSPWPAITAMCGVAICGRPVSRYYDNGQVLEILRCCTDGTYNACSKLYGACCRVGFAMGYRRVITYTLKSERGASLRAAGFTCDGEAGGKQWSGDRRRSYYVAPEERKLRWSRVRTRWTGLKRVRKRRE